MASQSIDISDLWVPGTPLPGRAVLKEIAQRCGEIWQIPGFADRVRIGYNQRLRSTLGRALLNENRVELNTRLLLEHPDQLLETLVHELAHLAVRMRYGSLPAPHGSEFKAMMRAANLSGKATHNLPTSHLKQKRKKYYYVHRCSDCQMAFVARKVRRNCYCKACGPEMSWEILRIADSPQGREAIAQIVPELRKYFTN